MYDLEQIEDEFFVKGSGSQLPVKEGFHIRYKDERVISLRKRSDDMTIRTDCNEYHWDHRVNLDELDIRRRKEIDVTDLTIDDIESNFFSESDPSKRHLDQVLLDQYFMRYERDGPERVQAIYINDDGQKRLDTNDDSYNWSEDMRIEDFKVFMNIKVGII